LAAVPPLEWEAARNDPREDPNPPEEFFPFSSAPLQSDDHEVLQEYLSENMKKWKNYIYKQKQKVYNHQHKDKQK